MITDVAQAIINKFNSNASQVDTFTPVNIEVGDTWTLTVIDGGTSDFVAYTAADTSAITVCNALILAWNAEGGALFTGVTASGAGTGTVILTSEVAAEGFLVVQSSTNGGSSNTQQFQREGTVRAGGGVIRSVMTGGLWFTEADSKVAHPYGVFTWDGSDVDELAGDNRNAIETANVKVSLYSNEDDGCEQMFDMIQKWITLYDSAELTYPIGQYRHLQITRMSIINMGKVDNVWTMHLFYEVMYEH